MIALAAYLVIGVIFMMIPAVITEALDVSDGAASAVNAAVLFAWPVAVPLGVIFSLLVWLASGASRFRDWVATATPAHVRAVARDVRRVLRYPTLALAVLLWSAIAFAMIATFAEEFVRRGAPL